MEIIFLGTGGGRIVLSTQHRSTGGFILKTKNNQVHIDPGSGALLRMRIVGINPRKTNVVCVSHNHTDHAGDIKAVSESIKKGVFIAPKKIVSKNRILEKKQKKSYRKIHGLSPGQSIRLNGLKITGTKARHGVKAIGFIFEAQGKRIGYTGDTTYFNGLSHQFESMDVLIINVLRPGNFRLRNHLCTEQVISLLEKMEKKPKLVVLTHFGMKMLHSGTLNEARKVSLKTDIPCRAAEDGMRLKLDGFTT